MQLHHDRGGTGPTLVLVHGLGSEWHAWAPVLARLRRERDVIALDLPGFGQSPSLPTDTAPTATALAEAVAAFLDALGIARAHLAGNSLGGWVALELARRNRARSATLISPGGFWNEAERRYATLSLKAARALGRRFGAAAPRILAQPLGRVLLLSQVVGRPAQMPAAAALEAARAFVSAPGFDTTLAAAAAPGRRFRPGRVIDCPITIAWGDRDRLLPPWQARRAAAALPGARVVRLHGCGHVPMWDDPEGVAALLLAGSGG
jgi:pimeloyl-ACP methyl ester carboxylesterase